LGEILNNQRRFEKVFTRQNEYASRQKQAAPTSLGVKSRIKNFFRNIILTTLASVQPSFEDRFLRPLYCHYVFDDQKQQFEELIIELNKLGTFVNTDTLLNMLQGETEIDNRYFHLSFDDGFRNIFTNAIPILRKHKVPAILFVPTSIVDADYETARKYCLETTRYGGVIEMIRWSELREVVSHGFEVGSHTKSHARLALISKEPTLLEEEISGSKRKIEETLGIECKYISWPYGTRTDVDCSSLEMVRNAGYRACFGAFRGSIRPNIATDKYSVPRHHIEVQWPLSHIKYFARGNMENS
jgi:peptidoglycan/xylan/chitin deacetylase (PgdA/CDA1 family)